MAEDTPADSRTEVGEAPVERAPSAVAKTAPVESAPEASKEQETEKVNGTQEKPSGKNFSVPLLCDLHSSPFFFFSFFGKGQGVAQFRFSSET